MPRLALFLPLAAMLTTAATAPTQHNKNPSEAIGRGVETQLLPEVTSRLRSKNLATVAWGAHIAARHRLAPAVPALLSTMSRLQKEPGLNPTEVRFAALALLDALVQTKAVVSFEDFGAYAKGHTLPALFVLLARDVRKNRKFLVAHYQKNDQQGRRSYWLACGNLLAASKDDELGGLILPTLTYKLYVTVRDPDDLVGAGIGRGGGGRFGEGKLNVPEGFPPTVLYQLTTRGRTGDTLIAPGVIPVFARRSEHKRRRFGIGSNEPIRRPERQKVRLQWLAELLDTYLSSLGNFAPRLTVDWQDPAHYVESVAKQKALIEKSFAKLVERCVKSRVLDEDLAEGLQAEIEFQVFDLREKSKEPLPKLK